MIPSLLWTLRRSVGWRCSMSSTWLMVPTSNFYHEILFLRGFKGVKTGAVHEDYLPWSKFKSGCWPVHRCRQCVFLFSRGNHFHDMGCFSNLFVVCVVLTCSPMYFLTMFHLRQKLGVRIQHLIGSDMEPLLLGCGDSTKVHPKVTKPLKKIAFSCATCTILAQCNCLAGASVSFQVLILFRHCRHHV